MVNNRSETSRLTKRGLGRAALGVALMVCGAAALASGTRPAPPDTRAPVHRGSDRNEPREEHAYLGTASMAPGSEYDLGVSSANIVGLIASARYPGMAVVTASGNVCVQHVAGNADSVLLQVTVDGKPAVNSFQQFSIPAAQADGTVCNPFSITGKFIPFLAVSHSIWLAGTANAGRTYVTDATLSAIVHY